MPADIILSGAGNPDTFTFRDTTAIGTPPPVDPVKQFNFEWDAAQKRYQAGVNSGYSQSDADSMFLAPVRNKFEILKSVPTPLKAQAAKELDAARLSYLKGINSGYQAPDAENLFLKPAEQKWTAAAEVAVPPDPMIEQYKAGAKESIRNGIDESEVMRALPPALLGDTKFVAELDTEAREAFNQKAKAANTAQAIAARTAKENSPLAVDETAARLVDLKNNKNWAAEPPEIQAKINQDLSAAEARMTNAPPTAEEIVAQQHPNWTADQVKLGAAGKLGGATEERMQIFTDKSGKKFIYKGNLTNPALDKNPDNWQVTP